MTPPKPEPVETAEEFVTNLKECTAPCCDDCAAAVRERDAALVADAEARGVLKALDELEAGACATPGCDCWRMVISQVLREKYTKGGADGG